MKMNAESIESFFQEKIISPQDIGLWRDDLRMQGKTLATLNGSFDLLHAGHLYILFEASKCADVLLVALNSDSSIQQYKSLNRPIIPLSYRLQMISSIAFVDKVTWFDEVDPRRLIKDICPDIHVNGAEYGTNCIEAETVKEIGARLHIVDRIPGLATSSILQKIQTLSEAH